MKKTLILVGVLSIGCINAQEEGKVGINTEVPKATLHINSIETDRSQRDFTS